ncbi:MAG: divergent polysaccharide deacetylase family protein, partial [Deltaproteobacteria bacterium]|nr:divergent polysaccharide deacetylase family protein [Deltaproteobacteria bacterium]
QKNVPGAIGGNNHMGSRFTANREAMRRVLTAMKNAGLFFIDSRTIADSVAFDEARRMQLPTAERSIFLDHHSDVAYVSAQLHKLITLAEDKGFAIAICHPRPETFAALEQNQPWLQAQKVRFVKASQLVKVY